MTDQIAKPAVSSRSESAPRKGFTWRIIFGRQEIGLLAVFLLWCAFLSLATDTFLTSTNVFNMLRAFSWIAIAAFGQCLVILTAGIDLSVGSNMALSGLAAHW